MIPKVIFLRFLVSPFKDSRSVFLIFKKAPLRTPNMDFFKNVQEVSK